MRYYKYFLIIILVVFSCTSKKKTPVKKYDLKGSWGVVVNKDSIYYEAFYNDSTYQYYFGDDDYLSSPTKYVIKSDTLFAYRKWENKETKYTNFIGRNGKDLFIIEGDKRKVKYIPIDSSEYTLNKIKNEKDFEEFRKVYLSRKHALIRKGIVKKDGR